MSDTKVINIQDPKLFEKFICTPEGEKAFNEAVAKAVAVTKGNRSAAKIIRKPGEAMFKADVEVTEVNEGLGIVFGWGMITDVNNEPYYDLDNQHISSDLMVKATSEFMESDRISNDSHTASDIGVVVHSFPLSKEIANSMGINSNLSGWMVGVKPSPDILAKFVSGEYTGFSIEGSGQLVDEGEV